MTPLPHENASLQAILLVCEEACNVPNIYAKSRERDTVLARHIAYKLMRENLMMSLKGISDVFGMDHSSVIHGLTRINDLLHANDALAKQKFRTVTSDPRLEKVLQTLDQRLTILVPANIQRDEFLAYICERYPDCDILM
jgi:hypothetical protein